MRQKTTMNTVQIASVFIVTAFFITLTLSIYILYPFPSKEKTSYFNSETTLIFNNSIYNEGVWTDGQLFLPITFIKEYIDPNIYMENSSESVIITTEFDVFQLTQNQTKIEKNYETISLSFPVLKNFEGHPYDPYVAADWLEDVYPIEITRVESTGAIFIKKDGDQEKLASVKPNGEEYEYQMRTEPNFRSSYVHEVKPEEKLILEESGEKFSKARSEDGYAGFLPNDLLSQYETKTIIINQDQKSYIPSITGPINVTWDAIYQANNNPSDVTTMAGVNVISPTWFHVKDSSGEIENMASKTYVKDAHKEGYQVWALFSNDFDPDKTHDVLSSFDRRKKMIQQLLAYAEIYGIQGLNVDFENVYEEDGPFLTQFMRELTPLAHEAGLTISMDITFISNSPMWSKFYEREELAGIVDYFMVMAYDEQPGGSSVAGSVSSLPWVEKHLIRTLEVIPSKKVLLGIPFYTRLWTEEKQEDGSVKVSSKALTMDQVKHWIEKRGVEPVYDQASGQDYVEVVEGNKTYRVWIENLNSLKKRVRLAEKYELAGIASWNKYFAEEEAFLTLESELKSKNLVKSDQP
ncbi:glycosyl hydrolase family 18 protein [Bacillaceae bacterium S4-13-56]